VGSARLISGWMLYEARRRLGDALVLVDVRGGVDGKVWIEQGEERHVVEVVTRDLARGHRQRVTPELLGSAFDALVGALRSQLSRLATYGLAHERPTNTARLREAVLAGLIRQFED